MKTKTTTRTITVTDTGFELSFKPQDDDDVLIEEKDGKIILRYLVQDSDPQPPNEDDDTGLFLVNYHRDFWVENKEVITNDQLVDWYRGEKIDQAKLYWIYNLTMYSHSGVCLSLGSQGFACDGMGWDTSRVGAVFVCKKEWPRQKKAEKAAACLVRMWNNYLSGSVWGCITDVFDAKTKERIEAECESCWGYNDEYSKALESLKKNEI
jgi:hypothetical protein